MFEAKMVRVPQSEFDEPVEYECIIKNLKNGEYTIFYNLQKTGLYKTHITNEGNPILGSPFDTVIEPGLVDASQVKKKKKKINYSS